MTLGSLIAFLICLEYEELKHPTKEDKCGIETGVAMSIIKALCELTHDQAIDNTQDVEHYGVMNSGKRDAQTRR